jgi:hypothetical protein
MFKDYFRHNKVFIVEELERSEFKNTAKVLLSFYKKSESIEDVIKEIDFQLNYYPCVILLRSQIEHFILATYIWIKFRITNKDEVAKKYYEEYLVYEMIKRINYSKSNAIPISGNLAKIFRKVLDILTDHKILKQKHFEKLNIEANQFDIRKISKFFDDNLPLKYDNIIKSETIKGFLEYYNYFSSFVHGGPSADAMCSDEYKNEFINEAHEFVTMSTTLVGFQRLFILYFLSLSNNEIKRDFQNEMDKLIKTGA